jgi:lipid-binding SYLF domain-containing protein
VKKDNGANQRLYGKKVDPKDILFKDTVTAPAAAQALDAALTKYSPKGGEQISM